mgnify:CR=1 FL=1
MSARMIAASIVGASLLISAADAQDLSAVEMPRGYKALDLPKDFGGMALAGALVQLSDKRGFRYLGHLTDCGLPEKALQVVPALGPDAQISQRRVNVDLGVGAKLLRLFSLEMNTDRVAQVEVILGPVVDEMVVPIRVLSAALAHGETLNERCGAFIAQDNVFWVNNALKAESLTIRLLDETGAGITASATELRGVVSGIGASADVEVGSGGALLIRKPLYIAFRDAPPVELLTGNIELFSEDDVEKPVGVTFGDEVYK